MNVVSPVRSPEVSSGEPGTESTCVGLKQYASPSLVTYGSLGEITQLDGNQEFDGLAGTEGRT